MNKKTYGAIAMSLLLGLTSCSDETPWGGSGAEAGLKLRLTADGRVMNQTRASEQDYESPVVPEVESFTISMTSKDGSYAKEWDSVEGFNREKSFPVGDYVVAASFGDIDREGFDNPFFLGQAPVSLAPGAEETVNITATLANSMVSIRYSEKFQNSFSAYSSAVQSEGHDRVEFTRTESRPAYIAPGDVKLNLTLTNFQDKQVTIQPTGFKAQPRHHYIITIDIDETSGDMKLAVEFEDTVESETVEVSLGDELFNSPEPTVTAVGFEDGVPIEGFEFVSRLPEAQFKVIAFGGLSKTNLTVISDGYSPSFGREVQLVGASASLQQQLAAEGVECVGFFRNVDKMGVVTVTDFLKTLPRGEYTVQVEAVDALTRVSEPVKLVLSLNKVDWEFGEPSSVAYGATEVVVDINTNCEEIKDKITFRAPDENNRMVDVPAENVSVTSVAPQGDKPYTLRYVLKVDPQTGKKVDVDATFGGSTQRTSLPVGAPDVSILTDPFAMYVVLQFEGKAVEGSNGLSDVRVYNAGSEVRGASLVFDNERKQAIVMGLEPGTTYDDLTVTFGNYEIAVDPFTTEQATPIPNGDFSASENTINFPNVKVGGEFTIRVTIFASTSQIFCNIIRDTPTGGWATLNDFTCYGQSRNQNTWYMVPSTWTEGEKTVIRSVGYHHDGEDIKKSDNGTSMDYYCKTIPSNFNKTSGELFLGSYKYENDGEQRENGISWSSRPSTLSFDYTYTGLNDEKGEAYVVILGENDEELVRKTVLLDNTDSEKTVTVGLDGYQFGKKAEKLVLSFKSTQSDVAEPYIKVPSGSELREEGLDATHYIGNRYIADNSYHAVATGSVLTIDNVTLGYDPKASAPAAIKGRKTNKRR